MLVPLNTVEASSDLLLKKSTDAHPLLEKEALAFLDDQTTALYESVDDICNIETLMDTVFVFLNVFCEEYGSTYGAERRREFQRDSGILTNIFTTMLQHKVRVADTIKYY